MSSFIARRTALGAVLSGRLSPTRRPFSMVGHCSPSRLLPNSHYASFSSFPSKSPILSQAESKLLQNYINELQTVSGPRFLAANYYRQHIQSYLKNIDRTAVARAELGNGHVPAAPILEVLSVKLQSSNKYDHDYQVYGVVQLIDELNNVYDVFHRKSDNPEIVSPGGNLSLTDSYGRPTYLLLSLASSFKMRVHLRDVAADGKEIAKGDFDLLLMDNENITTQVVHSPDSTSFASVQYLTLLHGIIANVEYRLSKVYLSTVSRSYSSYHGDIYGNITATVLAQGGNIISRVLFNKSPSESIRLSFDAVIKLCTAMFAIPACSSLYVKAELWDRLTNQQIVDDVIFPTRQDEESCWLDQICVLGQDYHSRLEVNFKHAYEMQGHGGYLLDKPELLSDRNTSSALGNRRSLLSKDVCLKPSVMPHISGSKMVEVFSISITPDRDVNLRLCGTIKVGDIMDPENKSYCIFERNKLYPEPLSGDLKIKSLEWPSCPFNGKYFGMHLHLFDDAGREVCKGFLHWDKSCIDDPISWYDKGISSVIRGLDGYATVHYAIFSNAVQATVKVIFIPNTSFDGSSLVVIGNIVARYSSFLYSSYVEKKFFQSALFGDYRYPILAAGGSLLLQKSVVAVPVDSSLILDFKLQPKVMDDFSAFDELEHYGTLDEAVDFQIDVGKTTSKRIEGKGFDVQVSVEWSILDDDQDESDVEVVYNSP